MSIVKINEEAPIINGVAVSSVVPKLGEFSEQQLPSVQVSQEIAGLGLAASSFSDANDTVAPASPARHHSPAANTAAVVTFAADPGTKHVITKINWSYDAEPTSGLLTVSSGGQTVFSQFITASGPGFHDFHEGLKGPANSAMVVTLSAGGTDVSGAVSVTGYRKE